MDKEDIRDLRRWHRAAARRAQKAGFDIIYCYAGHNLALAMHFLLKRYNQRSDEYGGSLENRTRLLRELIEDTKEAVDEAKKDFMVNAVPDDDGDDVDEPKAVAAAKKAAEEDQQKKGTVND